MQLVTCNSEEVQRLSYLWVGTRVEKTAAGEERRVLVIQMMARLRMMVVRPVLGARGRTMAWRGYCRANRNEKYAPTFEIFSYMRTESQI